MRILIILLLLSTLRAGELELSGLCSLKLPTHNREGVEYLSIASLASALNGIHFFVPEKAKGVLKLWGHEFVFTYANPYAILDGKAYRLRSAPRLEGTLFLIAIVDLVFLLERIAEFDVKYSGSKLEIKPRDETGSMVVVIDPGHGGKDPGAIGRKGTREKDIVLDVALRVKKLLEASGIEVVLTRDEDTFVPLAKRAEIANARGAQLFVSIHCNASKNRKYSGCETFFLSPAKNSVARNTAALENAALLLEENPPVKDMSEIESIIADMLHTEYIKESYHLAELVQRELVKRLGREDRGINQAGFYVLAGAFMPSVLVELAFISNPSEERFLRQGSFRQKAAIAISKGVIEFLNRQGGKK